MPKIVARAPIPRWLAAVALCAVPLGCEAPGGASLVVDPLVQVAIGMNRSGSREQTWSYRHESAEPYWVVAAPAGTKASELDTIDFPDNWRSAAKNCVNHGQAVVILADATECSCVRPIVVPEVHDFHSVRKGSGEETVFTLHKSKGDPWLVAVE